MWEAADATFQHAPRDPGGGGLASTAATEATDTLPGLQSAVATQRLNALASNYQLATCGGENTVLDRSLSHLRRPLPATRLL